MHSLHARHSPSCIKLGQWGGTSVNYVEKPKSYKRIEKLHYHFLWKCLKHFQDMKSYLHIVSLQQHMAMKEYD